jgi:hypothetical protein
MTSISDLSDIILVGRTLSTPLLSNLPEYECDESDTDYYDEEEGYDADYYDEEGDMPCPQEIVFDDNDDDDDDDESDEVAGDDCSSNNCVNCVAWDGMHALLFLQFGKVLCLTGAEATSTTALHWSLVNYGILLFVAIAIFYHKTVKDYKLTWTVLLLAPEILIIIIMGLVILDQLVAAFLFMLGSILLLALLVTMITIRGWWIGKRSSAEVGDCKKL